MSENTSDAASQYLLGFLYASGLKGVEQDQSRVSRQLPHKNPLCRSRRRETITLAKLVRLGIRRYCITPLRRSRACQKRR